MTRQNIHSDIDKEKAKQHLPNRSAQYGTNAAAISDESERTLLTANGEQTIYEAVSRCNRCNICSQNCPSYDINKKEQLSPRGRSQLFRLIKEEKLKSPTASLKETLATCYLCGACEDICKSSIPIPEIVLELRKRYLPSAIGFGRAFALYLKLNYPKIYDFWTRTGLMLFKLKLGTLSRLMCTAGMLGRGNREFEKLKIVPPFHCALSKLSKNRAAAQEQNVKWAYFSSCDTNYIMPEIALSTVELLQRHMGYGILFNNTSSGLASWRFGREKEAELFVKKNIEIFERLRREHGKFIVVTDSSAVAAFLKNCEQIFIKEQKKACAAEEDTETVRILDNLEETNTSQTSDIKNLNKIDDAENIEPDEDMWRKRAREFARSVRDIAEIFTPEDFPNMENCLTKKETICIQNSCGLVHYQKVQERPLKILRYMAGKFFKNLPNNSTCSGGRKYNVPVPQQMLDRTARSKVQSIASIQANIVITTDSCCLLSIRKELRDCYPSSKVMHISVFLNETEKRIKHLN